MKQLSLTLFYSLLAIILSAQGLPPAAQKALEKEAGRAGLTALDITDCRISDSYTDRWGVQYYYLNQTVNGIPVHNALMTIVINKDGKAYVTADRFYKGAAELVTSNSPSLRAEEAVQSFSSGQLQRRSKAPLEVKSRADEHHVIFGGGDYSNSDIPVELKYVADTDGLLHLTWDFPIDEKTSADYWSVRVDANSGQVLDKVNWTVYCAVGPMHDHDNGCNRNFGFKLNAQESTEATALMPASYRVFPFPAESPIHGEHELIVDPADSEYSPYGWHDIDGVDGAEFTITRGNNTHAYLDLDDSGQSKGDEPEGGPDLVFDFPFDENLDPDVLQDASVTNMFYAVNFMHDFTYNFGFDELAGNFQANNYGKGGMEEDYVLSQGQDGSGTNNANFATPPDGGSGRMQMFLWDNGGGELFQVTSPETLKGGYESREGSGWGIVTEGLSFEGDLVLVQDDHPENPTYGCETIQNAAELNGNIAVIDRGGCEFGFKAQNAENAGAIAVIICNFEDQLIGMGPGAVGTLVTIPTIMLKSGDCQRIKVAMANGGVSAKIERPMQNGPQQFDAGFDNGVIAHEFGHGISNRLTGGPSEAGCLGNDEQMGEGWSDFFTLVTTVEEGDTGADPRGIGNYVTAGGVLGRGIRRYPYSTDMTICPLTFDDIKGTTAPHPLGEVWAATLWDMYWKMVEKHGYDADIRNPEAGNNMAVQLVMDGMKLQPCGPGFLDGRDAILLADTIRYGGENAVLIWECFARRGLGYYADQGSPGDRNDGVENFETCPPCYDDIRVVKSLVEDILNPGEESLVTIRVSNFRNESSTNVVVTEPIPQGLTYVDGTASNNGQFSNGVLTWELGTMEALQEMTLSYTVAADPGIQSRKYWYDDVEDEDKAFEVWGLDLFEGFQIWDRVDFYPNSGEYSWYVSNVESDNDQLLFLNEPVEIMGDKPALRFYHWYSTGNNHDAGMVQVRREGSDTWENVGDKFIRNGYEGDLDYSAFTIPFLQGFYGESNGFEGSYLDLSDYAGEKIYIRFRFGSDEAGIGNSEPFGWVVDDIEFMDLVNYDYEACVSYSEGEDRCAAFGNGGLIINSGDLINSNREYIADGSVQLFPNPAGDFATLTMDEQYRSENYQVVVYDLGGSEVWRGVWGQADEFMTIPLTGLTSGFYTVRMSSDKYTMSVKLVHN